MSILIKGMSMPKDDCEAYRELIITNNYVGNGKIQMLAHDSNTNEFIGEAVEVPTPHGDLVDRDDIEVDVWEDFDGPNYELHSKTVIEAEEQEHE